MVRVSVLEESRDRELEAQLGADEVVDGVANGLDGFQRVGQFRPRSTALVGEDRSRFPERNVRGRAREPAPGVHGYPLVNEVPPIDR